MIAFHRFALGLIALALVVSGCGDAGPGTGASGADAGVGNNDPDIVINTDSGTTDEEDAGPVDTGSETPDVASPDDAAEETCPGGADCPCTEHSDCDNGICLQFAASKQCARKCVDSCDDGKLCVPFSGGGGDGQNVCAPTQDWLCDPCTKSEQCQHVGISDAVCVDFGPENGAFCGIACSDDAGCPTGYACKPSTSIEGASTSQCVPFADGAIAQCSCSDAAKDKKLQTACAIISKDDKGNVLSQCAGVRSCQDAGLSACIGPSPEAETCDGVDNDCNGQTDEATCDDKNPCTQDACKAADKECAHIKLDGPCDADGSKCTQSDKCTDGVCVAGKTKQCDDGNPCTLDGCVALTGACTVTNDDGKACEADGNPCTVGDNCVAGKCTAGKEKPCVATNKPCIAGSCSPATGNCAFTERPDGTSCDDGSLCSDADTCSKGQCLGKPVACDDGNSCTNDACQPATGCVNAATTQPCDDGDKCTKNDVCADGSCAGLPLSATKDCDDGNACTIDACGAKTGCTNTATEGVCTDGDACSTGDVCTAGTCKPTGTAQCDDGNPCTVDSCDKAKGCVNQADVGKKLVCYDGKDGTAGQGTCKQGTQTCAADGKPGPCIGQVTPAAKETCDGKDDTCDGLTDEGCGAGSILVTTSNGSLQGGAGKYAIEAKVGASGGVAGPSGGAGTTIDWGLYRWLKAVIP